VSGLTGKIVQKLLDREGLITVEMPHILLLILTAGLGFRLGVLSAFFNSAKSKESKK
jgi:hypothetical protein